MKNMPGALHGASMSGGTDYYLLPGNKLHYVLIVAVTVLKRHNDRVLADESHICLHGSFRHNGLDKYNNQVRYANIFRPCKGPGSKDFTAAIALVNSKAFAVNDIDVFFPYIQQVYFIFLRQVTSVQATHGSGTNY